MNYLKKYCIGVHLSKRKNLEGFFLSAQELDINTFAFFTAPSLRYSYNTYFDDDEYERFINIRNSYQYKIFSHASYLINIADKSKTANYNNSVLALEAEILRCHKLGVSAIAFHPGSNVDRQLGIETIASTINSLSVLDRGDTILCIESSAGQGNTLPTSFQEMAMLDSMIFNKRKVGFVLDSCHLFAAGYDLSRPDKVVENINLFDTLVGLDRLIFIHLNDAKKPCGSHLDRHETLGKGYIGKSGISALLLHEKIKSIPKILETPVDNYLDWRSELQFINGIYNK